MKEITAKKTYTYLKSISSLEHCGNDKDAEIKPENNQN